MNTINQTAKAIVKSTYARVASLAPVSVLITGLNKLRHQRRPERRLEIGPGGRRLPGFETLNIVAGFGVDYIADAARKLPFPDNTFDVIYASHILEHIPWFQTLGTLKEWARALKPEGVLEIWVPDGLKICETLVKFEREGVSDIDRDNWYKFNPEHETCKWAAGRLYTYGDGTGRLNHPNWHRSLFTPRYLKLLFAQAGLADVREMDRAEVRGSDHGWINLGVRGVRRNAVEERRRADVCARAESFAPANAEFAAALARNT